MGTFTTKLPLMLLMLCFITKEFVPNVDAHLTKCLELDRKALIDFKNGLEDPANLLSSWINGSNCCEWWGISCDSTSGAVIAVDLLGESYFNESSERYVHYELGGEIRPSLTKLKSLRHLDLSFNNFSTIPIPQFFGSLKTLHYLNLSHAEFSGSVPHSNLEWLTGLVSLKHLVLDGNDLSMVGTEWIRTLNKLPSLTELHLSSCGLTGSIPPLTTVNLTSLVVLDLSNNDFNSKMPVWLVNFSSLVTLDMSWSGFFGRIPLGFSYLPSLQSLNLRGNNLEASCHLLLGGIWDKMLVLDLAYNSLHGKLPVSIGNLTFLTHLDLSNNNIEGGIPSSIGNLSFLTDLDLSNNNIEGGIPSSIGNLSFLTRLYLFLNSVEGGIPSSIGNLCNLMFLDLDNNNMNGTLPEFLEGTENCHSRWPLPSLQDLYMSDNHLVGKLPEWMAQLENLVTLVLYNNSLCGRIPPSFGILQRNLTTLNLGMNELNGTLPISLGQLSKLEEFDVSSNQLTGIINETFFSKLEMLSYLSLSSNSFSWNVSSNWVPPFQVQYLRMSSCNLGPSFPTWLKSQKHLTKLDISNNNISGSIPYWFWEFSFSLTYLKLSFNQLEGQLPSSLQFSIAADVDFSSNNFSGSIPVSIAGIGSLDLSKNKLSGNFPNNITQGLFFLSIAYNQIKGEIPDSICGIISSLQVVDLSNNNFMGSIPSSIGNCSDLSALDISNNFLSGTIPTFLGQLNELRTLHLNYNNLSGNLPLSFQNLSSLETFNLGNNRLTGRIPPWIGKGFSSLRFISMRSNSFSGELPDLLSNLSSLQVLDLADNQLIGSIPASFGHFKAMLQVQIINHYLTYMPYNYFCRYCYIGHETEESYDESLLVYMKGRLLRYSKTLSLVIGIDLSSNNLSGDLPTEITNLVGLLFLDLSRNQITGNIPESISKMKQLLSIDLSSNRFSGAIPQSLGKLSFLGYLNLSNNNLSGNIPYTDQMMTFDATSFAGNRGLCGGPLAVTCSGDEGRSTLEDNGDGDSFIDNWFYSSIGLGFATGILVPYLLMALRRSWSIAYFGAVDKVLDRIQYMWLKYRAIKQRTRQH